LGKKKQAILNVGSDLYTKRHSNLKYKAVARHTEIQKEDGKKEGQNN